MDNLLTLNNERLDQITERAIDFTKDSSIEADIASLVDAKKKIEEAIKRVQSAFKDQFTKGEMENSIEGDVLRVSISPSGSIYKLVDETKVDPHLLKLALDSEAVQSWVDENEKLPEGVEYNQTRGLAVRITVKGAVHE